MVTDYDVNIRFKPVLDLVVTLQMVMQQNVISNWNNQFLACGLTLIMFIGLIDVLEDLLVSMHHGTKLLVQPDSLRLKTV